MLDSHTGAGCEATVKTLRRQDGNAWLLPQNSAYAPILGDNPTIIGRS
jgi:repressor LexA